MELDAMRIKVLLAEREMSQADLAKKCGVSRQQVSKILLRKSCSLKTVGKIANALRVAVTDVTKEVL